MITITHRLQTILDYDKVLVMDKGEVLQFGHPFELLQRGGAFWELCKNDGNLEKLEGLAKMACAKRKT